jgi:hypothetical protein
MPFRAPTFSFTVPFGRRSSRTSDVPPATDQGWSTSLPPIAKRSRRLLFVGAFGAALVAANWFAIRTFPWFGPMLADNLRKVLGSERVTQLEEIAADVEDRVHQAASDGKARSLSESTPEDLIQAHVETTTPVALSNKPATVGALHKSVATAEDGVWQPVLVRTGNNDVLYRTIVHPDPERAYAELFVFALDLSKVQLHAVAGSIEPRSESKRPGVERPGVVPEADRAQLIAAFNGGFKAEHGHFGMMVNKTELLPPKAKSCTFGAVANGGLRIGTWSAIENSAPDFSWWRQTPGCMIEDGVLHPGLRSADSRNWGATLEGKTVIRRSAAGLSKDGSTLFIGISNSTTARALALGMQHAGAENVAQLDVNFSFPRFLLYREDGTSGKLTARGAVKGLMYDNDEYIGRASTRDFFYVTLR